MFQNVRQSCPFYILEKGANFNLKIGSVIGVSNPMPKYPTTYVTSQFQVETVVDIKVQVGDEQIEFKQLPANVSIANFGNNGIVVSDDYQAMSYEIESYINNSKKTIESIPFHENVIKTGDEMLSRLNPQIAKDRENKNRIDELENKFDKMLGMLSDVIESKNRNKKGE